MRCRARVFPEPGFPTTKTGMRFNMQTNVTNTFSSKALFLAIPAGISIRFSKSICSSRSIFSYWVLSKFLENQSVHTKQKTDEKQSTISKLKRLYKICSIQGKFASEECNSEGTCYKFQKRKKNDKRKKQQ